MHSEAERRAEAGKQSQRCVDIAVLIPCYNEVLTIAGVVTAFKASLPSAKIYVCDNNSTDGTAQQAAGAGAIVLSERRQGKGHAVRQMFADIEADLYVLADGDGTNPPSHAAELVEKLIAEGADMAVATRRDIRVDAGRGGHAIGNAFFNTLYRFIFGPDFTDIFSGYRALTRRFVKSFPSFSEGFEVETEMSVHASRLMLTVCEIEVPYGRRPAGSNSKLSTFRDGFKILWMFAKLAKQTRPFFLFSILSAAAGLAGAFFGIRAVSGGHATFLPSLILSSTAVVLSVCMLTAGAVMDSIARSRMETLRVRFAMSGPLQCDGINDPRHPPEHLA